jgi:hypothetical protein
LGLSIAISGAIIMTIMVLVLYVFSGTAMNVFSLGEVSSEVIEHNDSISKSEISLHHVSTLVGSPNVNLTLRNDGQVKTWKFPMYDILVTYDGVTSGSLTEQLSYSGDCLGGAPASGFWCIQSIARDILDPGLLNPTEEASIRMRVNENLADENAIIVIATAKGVTSKVVAPYCGPNCYQMNWDVYSGEATLSWTNKPAAFTEFDGNADHRVILDLTDMSEWRLLDRSADSAGTADCVLGAQYSTDDGTTWQGLDNGIVGSMSTATNSCDVVGYYITAWSPLNVTAQAEVFLRLVSSGGNGAADPDFGTVQVQFRS